MQPYIYTCFRVTPLCTLYMKWHRHYNEANYNTLFLRHIMLPGLPLFLHILLLCLPLFLHILLLCLPLFLLHIMFIFSFASYYAAMFTYITAS